MRQQLWMLTDIEAMEFADGVCTLVPWDEFDPWRSNETSAPTDARLLKPAASSHTSGGVGASKRYGVKMSAHASSVGLVDSSPGSSALIGRAWLDCRPPGMTVISHWESLDVDGDGVWTTIESKGAESSLISRDYNATIDIMKTLGDESLAWRTSGYTVIPKDVFDEFAPRIASLCGLLDAGRCGNIEAKGVLKHIFPHVDYPYDRVDLCAKIVQSSCGRIMREEYRFYVVRHAQLCGIPVPSVSSVIHDNATVTINTVDFEQNMKYQEEISSIQFSYFMTIVLFVWLLAVFVEIRNCAELWEVLVLYPGQHQTLVASDSGEDEDADSQSLNVLQKDEDGINITYFPFSHRAFLVLMVAIPRTVLALTLMYIGANFLTASQTYQDAVLNCLALSFVLDVDAYIFNSIVSYDRKASLLTFKSLTVNGSFIAARGHWLWSQTFFHFILLGGAALIWSFWERHAVYGFLYKSAGLDCFCRSQGGSCMEAYELLQVAGLSPNSIPSRCRGIMCWLSPPGWAIAE